MLACDAPWKNLLSWRPLFVLLSHQIACCQLIDVNHLIFILFLWDHFFNSNFFIYFSFTKCTLQLISFSSVIPITFSFCSESLFFLLDALVLYTERLSTITELLNIIFFYVGEILTLVTTGNASSADLINNVCIYFYSTILPEYRFSTTRPFQLSTHSSCPCLQNTNCKSQNVQMCEMCKCAKCTNLQM